MSIFPGPFGINELILGCFKYTVLKHYADNLDANYALLGLSTTLRMEKIYFQNLFVSRNSRIGSRGYSKCFFSEENLSCDWTVIGHISLFYFFQYEFVPPKNKQVCVRCVRIGRITCSSCFFFVYLSLNGNNNSRDESVMNRISYCLFKNLVFVSEFSEQTQNKHNH